MEENSRKQTLIVVIAVATSLLSIVLLVILAQHIASTRPTTIGKVHEGNAGAQEFSITPLKPAVDGFGVLLDNGLTTDQLDLVNKAVHRYAPFVKNVDKLTLDGASVHPNFPEQSDPLYRWSVSANLNADSKATYQMRVYYWGTDTVQVLLFDASGTKLYDSGVMSASSQS